MISFGREIPVRKISFLFLALLFFGVFSLSAQEPAGRTIEGKVLDESGSGLKDCRVFVYKVTYRSYGISKDELIAEGRTDETGKFFISNVRISFEPYTRCYVFAHSPGKAVDWQLIEKGKVAREYILGPGGVEKIAGRVFNEKGEPLSAALISVVRIRKAESAPFLAKRRRFSFLNTRSDKEGTFVLEGLHPESLVSLEVEHSYYARKAVNNIAPGYEDLEIEMHPGGAIKGRVIYESNGQGAEGVLLKCHERYSGRGREEALSDKDGRFELRGLPSGTFLVVGDLKSAKGVPDHVIVPRNNVPVEEGKITEDVELKLIEGVLISGKAYDEGTGEPVEGVRLAFSHRGGYSVVSTGADGKYKVRVLPGRIWRKVESFPQGHYVKGGSWGGGRKSVLEGKEGQLLTCIDFILLKELGVTVKLVDENGVGLGGTLVYYCEQGSVPVKKIADAEGKAFIEFSGKGSGLLIYAINEKARRGAVRLAARPGTLTGEITVRLFKVPVITGAVKDTKGKPIADAAINCFAVTGAPGLTSARWEVPVKEIRTDENGLYRIDTLVPGNVQYQFELFQEGYPLFTSKPFSLSDREELSYSDIVMSKADSFVAGKVTDADGSPVEGSWVEVYSGIEPRLTKTAEDGAYRIEQLPEGHVTIKIHHARYGVRIFEDVATGFENTDLQFGKPPERRPHVPAGPDIVKPEELVGKKAPPLGVSEWLGTPQKSISELKGNVILIDFFALWCGPCRLKLPETEEMHKKYREKGLLVIGLHGDENSPGEIREFCEELGLTFSVGIVGSSTSEEGGEVYRGYGVQFLPHIVLIDKKGEVRYVDVMEGLEEKIEELLKEEFPLPQDRE